MKKAVLYTTTLMQCKARQFLQDLFSTNQVAQKGNLWPGATKINLNLNLLNQPQPQPQPTTY